jgi:hypothetical protein
MVGPAYTRAALALISFVALIGSVLPISQTSLLAYEASRLVFAAAVFGSLILETIRAWRLSFGSARPQTAASKVYSVPRRFTLGGLLAVTLAFSVLSAVFRWALWEPTVVMLMLSFIGLVGASQFAFDQAPRHASVLAGIVFFSVPTGAYRLATTTTSITYSLGDGAFYAALWAIAGAVLGYCAGIVVGSVFMFIAGGRALMQLLLKKH